MFHRNAKGEISCGTHPDSYDLKCGICDIASAMESGRRKGEAKIHELAFTYLNDGLSPEEAEAKARENYRRLAEIHEEAQHIR